MNFDLVTTTTSLNGSCKGQHLYSNDVIEMSNKGLMNNCPDISKIELKSESEGSIKNKYSTMKNSHEASIEHSNGIHDHTDTGRAISDTDVANTDTGVAIAESMVAIKDIGVHVTTAGSDVTNTDTGVAIAESMVAIKDIGVHVATAGSDITTTDTGVVNTNTDVANRDIGPIISDTSDGHTGTDADTRRIVVQPVNAHAHDVSSSSSPDIASTLRNKKHDISAVNVPDETNPPSLQKHPTATQSKYTLLPHKPNKTDEDHGHVLGQDTNPGHTCNSQEGSHVHVHDTNLVHKHDKAHRHRQRRNDGHRRNNTHRCRHGINNGHLQERSHWHIQGINEWHMQERNHWQIQERNNLHRQEKAHEYRQCRKDGHGHSRTRELGELRGHNHFSPEVLQQRIELDPIAKQARKEGKRVVFVQDRLYIDNHLFQF